MQDIWIPIADTDITGAFQQCRDNRHSPVNIAVLSTQDLTAILCDLVVTFDLFVSKSDKLSLLPTCNTVVNLVYELSCEWVSVQSLTSHSTHNS